MDYIELAKQFLEKMHRLNKCRPQKQIRGSMQGEAFTLAFLTMHGGDVSPGEISGEMEISPARIAATLRSLERKGLVTRRISLRDRRHILVNLTPEGEARAEEGKRVTLETMAQMLSRLGERDAREYVRITARLAELVPNSGE